MLGGGSLENKCIMFSRAHFCMLTRAAGGSPGPIAEAHDLGQDERFLQGHRKCHTRPHLQDPECNASAISLGNSNCASAMFHFVAPLEQPSLN